MPFPSENVFNKPISESFANILRIYNGNIVIDSLGNEVFYLDNTSNPAIPTSASYAISASWAPGGSSVTSSYSLFAVSASYANTYTILSITQSSILSSSWASQSLSSSFAGTASNLNGFLFQNIPTINVSSSNFVIFQFVTESYVSAFFDYAVTSGSNMRVGTIFGGWNGANVTSAELTTTDLGDTSKVTMSMNLSASVIQLLSSVSSSLKWSVKTMVRYM